VECVRAEATFSRCGCDPPLQNDGPGAATPHWVSSPSCQAIFSSKPIHDGKLRVCSGPPSSRCLRSSTGRAKRRHRNTTPQSRRRRMAHGDGGGCGAGPSSCRCRANCCRPVPPHCGPPSARRRPVPRSSRAVRRLSLAAHPSHDLAERSAPQRRLQSSRAVRRLSLAACSSRRPERSLSVHRPRRARPQPRNRRRHQTQRHPRPLHRRHPRRLQHHRPHHPLRHRRHPLSEHPPRWGAWR
jgi:hypothetical protein